MAAHAAIREVNSYGFVSRDNLEVSANQDPPHSQASTKWNPLVLTPRGNREVPDCIWNPQKTQLLSGGAGINFSESNPAKNNRSLAILLVGSWAALMESYVPKKVTFGEIVA